MSVNDDTNISLQSLKKYRDIAVNNLQNDRETIYRNLISGGIAGSVSRTIVSPLERLKLIFMCGDARSRNVGIVQALKNIYSHEGFPGFFRGNAANVYRIFPFTAIQLSSYPFFKSVLTLGDDKNLTVAKRFWCGVSAGVLATFATYPLDLIRCRLSLQSNEHVAYKGSWDALVKITRNEGVLALYRGLWPSLLGILPYAGLQLSSYDVCKKLFSKYCNDTSVVAFASGGAAGVIAQTAAFPIEMLRRRMQVRGFQVGGIIDKNATSMNQKVTIWNELKCVLQESGWRGLYRGLWPNYVKIIPAAGVNFVVYEWCKEAWDNHRRKSTQM